MEPREGVPAVDRVHLFKLAWDLYLEAFGQRLLQYERYLTGDPIRRRLFSTIVISAAIHLPW